MVFIISDIHARLARLKKQIDSIEESIGRKLSQDDVIIILGDLFYTNTSKLMIFSSFPKPSRKTDLTIIGFLSMLPCKSLVVLGNHESPEKLACLRLRKNEHFGGVTYDYNNSVFFCKNGETYTIESDAIQNTFLALGGAYGHGLPLIRSMSKVPAPYMAKICSNCAGIEVDYVIAHDGPSSVIHPRTKKIFGDNIINRIFDSFKDTIKFKAWIYGHHHVDYDTGKFFCIYNRTFYIDNGELKELK